MLSLRDEDLWFSSDVKTLFKGSKQLSGPHLELKQWAVVWNEDNQEALMRMPVTPASIKLVIKAASKVSNGTTPFDIVPRFLSPDKTFAVTIQGKDFDIYILARPSPSLSLPPPHTPTISHGDIDKVNTARMGSLV
jgi:hypothetical protein